jgi:hypothetical protein
MLGRVVTQKSETDPKWERQSGLNTVIPTKRDEWTRGARGAWMQIGALSVRYGQWRYQDRRHCDGACSDAS